MGSNKLRVLLGASLLVGMLSVWFMPISAKDRFGHFLPFVMLGCLAVSIGMHVLASRLARTDVTKLEMSARRMLFKKSLPD